RYQIQSVLNTIVDSIQNGDEVLRQTLGLVLTPRHPSQLYAALLEGVLLFVITFWFWRKPRKPGVVGSVWFIGYALVRLFDEQFRMPDADLGFGMFGLTRGQQLSVGLLFAGIFLLIWMLKRPSEVVSGWGPEAQKLRDEEKPVVGKRKK
ncbi:MAG: prolipoprotein diacylglyceryl transferase family protein, partial [Bdellovibrionota bacterium]